MMNDVWKHSIATNEWTWMKGSNTAGQVGPYGSLGVSAPANTPGGRMSSLTWSNPATGDFYAFGGNGYYTTSLSDDMNDLWKYSPATNAWTWLKGNNTAPSNGVYGTLGTSAAANTLGVRSISAGWVDNSTNLWLFGGTGIPSTPSDYGYLNDLWMLSICTAPTLTITAGRSVICKGESVSIAAKVANTYSWNTVPAKTGHVIQVSPASTTTYVVTGTLANGCPGNLTYTQIVSNCSGISEHAVNALVKIYPNPNTGEFTINSDLLQENSTIVVFNAIGQKVLEQKLTGENTKIQSNLPSGVYFYQLMQNNTKA